MKMPVLETERLLVRPFTPEDLDAVHRILDVELGGVDFGSEGAMTLSARREWLEWSICSYRQLAVLHQPPYGDRAVVRKSNGELVGVVGFVPSFDPFDQLPSFGGQPSRNSPEFGLYYAISPPRQRQGYASEAGRAMVGYALDVLNLQRIVAITTFNNCASIGVMRRLGMRIERNPFPKPPWFQVVGILESEDFERA
jgi:RimJ/RimL family protein N-acetyltransferase